MNRCRFFWIMLLTAGACSLLAACGGGRMGTGQAVQPMPAQAAEGEVATPQQARPVAEQCGALDVTLLDGAELHARLTGYTFSENDGVTLDVLATNHSGNPATVWLMIAGINGWDVQNQRQAVTNLSLAPGEQKRMLARFDLAANAAQFLQLGALQSLALSTEGYVDTAEYDYLMQQSTVEIPEAPPDYRQPYAEGYPTLLDNEYLHVAYCGQNADTGETTLYWQVKTPAVDASCRLYPLEDGVYDMLRYPVADAVDLTRQSRRLVVLQGAEGALMTGLYALAQGIAMEPAYLEFPVADTEAEARDGALDRLPIVAENALLRIRYDAENGCFFAENLTRDQLLALTGVERLTLDSRTIRPNPLTAYCFPGMATAFRVSGRGKGEDGVERSVALDAKSRSASVCFSLSRCVDGLTEPVPLEPIEALHIPLQ